MNSTIENLANLGETDQSSQDLVKFSIKLSTIKSNRLITKCMFYDVSLVAARMVVEDLERG